VSYKGREETSAFPHFSDYRIHDEGEISAYFVSLRPEIIYLNEYQESWQRISYDSEFWKKKTACNNLF
jgi:hypothetical protein